MSYLYTDGAADNVKNSLDAQTVQTCSSEHLLTWTINLLHLEEHQHMTCSPAWILYTILHTENISTGHRGSTVLILNLCSRPNKPYLTNALPILYEGHGNAK